MKLSLPVSILKRLYPEEILTITFFCFLFVLSLKFGTPIKGPTVMVRAMINVFLVIVGLTLLSGRYGWTLVKVVRNWLPIIFFLLAYENLGNLVRFINPHDADPVLKRIDEFLFVGVNPILWLEKCIRPWLSEIMHACYTSYYPFLPTISLVLYLGRDYLKFRDVAVSVALGFYLGFIGYMLVPTVGPRFYMADQFTVTVKGTTMLSEMIYETLNRLESTRRDCFPSLHTAITVIVTTYAFRYRRWLFWILLPVNIGIVCATMYLRYHYVIDVIAGLAHAIFCIWAGPKVNTLWYRYVSGERVAFDYPERLESVERCRVWLMKMRAAVRGVFSRKYIHRK